MKNSRHKQSAITKSARGEQCDIRLPGVCTFDPEKVVWCHDSGSEAGHGMSIKASDIHGCYGCSACHNYVDRNGIVTPPKGMTWDDVAIAFYQAKTRSLTKLIAKGLVTIRD